MVGWHHRLNGHEFEQALGDSGGQRIRHNLATEQQRDVQKTLQMLRYMADMGVIETNPPSHEAEIVVETHNKQVNMEI